MQSRVKLVTDCLLQLSAIAWRNYGRLKWLEMVWGAHSTLDSSYIQAEARRCQSLSRTAVFKGPTTSVTGTFRLTHFSFHYEIKVRKRGKWSQYHVWFFFFFLKRLLEHQKQTLRGDEKSSLPANHTTPHLLIFFSFLVHTQRCKHSRVHSNIHKVQK